jgi:hypothetical protein
MHEKLNKAKEVIKNNWKPFTVGAILTGVTFIVTRQVTMRYMRISGTSTLISRTIANEGPLYKVFHIYAPGVKYQGPSWMVTCKETGKAFRSQHHAAKMMNISETMLSTHLNGKAGSAGGYHFERIGLGV